MGRPLHSKNKPKSSFGVPLKELISIFREDTVIFVDSMYLPILRPRSRQNENETEGDDNDSPIDFEEVTAATLEAKELLKDD